MGSINGGRPEISKLRKRQQEAVDRATNDRFFELAKFVYVLDMRLAVASICRTTPASVDDMQHYFKPVPQFGYEEIRKLADDLESVDCPLEYFDDTAEHVLHVQLAGNRRASLVPVRRVPMPAHRARWPFDTLAPGDWFFVPGRMGGYRNIAIACQRQNASAGGYVYRWQYLRGGTRVDRLI